MNAWHQEASTDEETICNWWQTWPQANVGVVLGQSSGIVDLEYDTDEGRQSLLRLFDGEVPATPQFESGRGRHHLFAWQAGLPAKATVSGATIGLPGLDIKLGGGAKASQSVFPPSRHAARAGGYQWVQSLSPDEVQVADLPDVVAGRLVNWTAADMAVSDKPPSKPAEHWARIAGGLPEGERGNAVASLIGGLLHAISDLESQSQLAVVLAAARAANQQNRPPLPDEEVVSTFNSILASEKRQRTAESERLESAGQQGPDQYRQNGHPVADEPGPSQSPSLAGLDYNKMDKALGQSAELRKLWHRKKSLSQAGYDAALAQQLVYLGWPDFEIAQAIWSHRKRGGEDASKPTRDPKYITNLLANARSGQPAAVRKLIEENAPDLDETRHTLTAVLGLESHIDYVRMVGSENPVYTIRCESGGELPLGPIGKWSTGRNLEQIVANHTGTFPSLPIAQPSRLKLYNAILDLRREVDAETGLPELLRDTMRTIIHDLAVKDRDGGVGDNKDLAVAGSLPFKEGDIYHFHLAYLLARLKRVYMQFPTRSEVAEAMSAIGGKEIRVAYTIGERRSSRKYWGVPSGQIFD